jgi:hypothetical protein
LSELHHTRSEPVVYSKGYHHFPVTLTRASKCFRHPRGRGRGHTSAPPTRPAAAPGARSPSASMGPEPKCFEGAVTRPRAYECFPCPPGRGRGDCGLQVLRPSGPGPQVLPRPRAHEPKALPQPARAQVGRVTRPTAPAGASAGPSRPRPRAPPDPHRDAPRTGLSQIKAASGLRSVARNNKATRLRTRPGRSTKSSAKDLSLRTVKLQSASRGAPLRGTPHRRPAVVRGRSLFVSDCGVQGRITPFRHGF